jgi:cyanophycinase
MTRFLQAVLVLSLICAVVLRVDSAPGSAPTVGAIVLDGGAASPAVVSRFVELAGGGSANIIFVPTAASSLKLGDVIYDPDSKAESAEQKSFKQELRKLFGVEQVTILHTRSRKEADTEMFSAPLRAATGIWFSSGNAGRLADAFLDTRFHRELKAFLRRNGVVGGSSAGAIIQGSYIVRGRPDKPLLMAKGHERGFALLPGLAINPHLVAAQRENELVIVLDAHPELLGIGIDNDSGVIVRGNQMEIIGEGKVAIYDNQKHGDRWYIWLRSGDIFDWKRRALVPREKSTP